jgi:hypothetical protein
MLKINDSGILGYFHFIQLTVTRKFLIINGEHNLC